MKYKNINLIIEKIIRLYNGDKNKLFLVLVGGFSRSGKSTFSEAAQKKIIDNGIKSEVICLDNWITDIDKRTGQENVRGRFDYSQIISSVECYLEGKEIRKLKYSPANRKKIKSNYIVKNIDEGIIIVEGVVALDIANLRLASNLNIYVETSENERKKRFYDFHFNVKNISLKESDLIYKQRQIDENTIIEKSRIFSDLIYEN